MAMVNGETGRGEVVALRMQRDKRRRKEKKHRCTRNELVKYK